jgi:hypothetical protein
VPAITRRKALLAANIKRDFISILLKEKASSLNDFLGRLPKAANAPRSWIVMVCETVQLEYYLIKPGSHCSPALKLFMRWDLSLGAG